MLARLHMKAVFPCLAALVRLDDDAQSLIAGQRFGVQLKTRSGLSSRLEFMDGEVRVNSARAEHRALELFFLSDRHLNRTFSGSGFSLPIPVSGFGHLPRMLTFSRLATRLQQILTASPRELDDEKLLAIHIDLLMGEVIPSAVAELARFDEHCSQWLAPYRDAVVQLEVIGGVSNQLRLGKTGAVRVSEPRAALPDVAISFRDRRVALAALRGDLDNLAALGKGQMTVRGLIPLADALDRVLERLGRFMRASK